MQFVVIRLGKDSVADIERLNGNSAPTDIPFNFDFTCAQVEEGIDSGDYTLIWLGSDNNKGQPTTWKQGLRAIGKIVDLDRGQSFNDTSSIQIRVLSIFPDSIDQFDFLERSATHYKYFSKYPVVGVRSSRNNAIQKVHEDDRQKTPALLTAVAILHPEIKKQLQNNAPELLDLLNFSPVGEIQNNVTKLHHTLDKDDVWSWVSYEVFEKHERNFLFLGPPGTGKTWYAHEVAKKLTENDSERIAFVQFHPSFSYDDFVEGYVPKLNDQSSSIEYSIKAKHFMQLCAKAKGDGSNLYVMVIDELSRGDPSRVFGELLTYLEVEHRNKEFSLAYSGDKIFVPNNVVVIATANPYDRSVGELDDALVRRFVMREFLPDTNVLKQRFSALGVESSLIERLIHVFSLINDRMPNGFGHSNFWNIRSEDDFKALWESRILFLLKRAFLFDEEGLEALKKDVEDVFPPSLSQNDEAQEEPLEQAGS